MKGSDQESDQEPNEDKDLFFSNFFGPMCFLSTTG